MNALKKKLEANLNERLKLRETEHNKLLKRYQNVKSEIEKQQKIELNKFKKDMQGYSTGKKQRPGTAKGIGASMIGGTVGGGSRMPASKPSARQQSRGVDWEAIASVLPVSKTDPAQVKARAKLWRGFDNNGNGYCSLAECQKGLRDVIKND